MTTLQRILTVVVLVAATALTRFLPFLIFRSKKTPPFVLYLGTVLPSAVFALLVVFCLKDVQWWGGTYGVPELIGVAVTIALHAWRRSMLLSIFGGTFVYMLVLHVW